MHSNSIEGSDKLVSVADETNIDVPVHLSSDDSHHNNLHSAKTKADGDYDHDKELAARKRVLSENKDEFLEPVLKEVKFEEIDLNAQRVMPTNDYDVEIEDDIKRIKPGLGEKGNKATVPSYQKPVADNIMKKEAFNRLLSEMISPNRSVPDTREAA